MWRRSQPLTPSQIRCNMAEANSFSHIGNHAINVLARLAAKNAVKEELKAQGVRVTLVKPAEITTQAIQYLASHPELYAQATERARLMGMFEKSRRKSA